MKQRKYWLIAYIVCLMSMNSTTIAKDSTERIFTNLYATGAWGKNEEGFGSSGPDSKRENTLSYVAFLQNFIRANNIQSVVDAGCGDWSFSKAVDWGNIRYVGIDIVNPVIEKNRQLYHSPQVAFLHGDINEIELPDADLLICKDVLQYLSNSDVDQFLKRIAKYKYCLITNDAPAPVGSEKPYNRSIVCGDHRPIDLTNPPFNVEGTKIFTYLVDNTTKHVLLITNNNEVQKSSNKKKCFVINNIHPFQGFFSVFLSVINYLNLYDTHDIDGLVVDFKNNGLYYEQAYGPNSWNYYFEPLELGSSKGAAIDYSAAIETGRVAYLAEIGLSRERIAELVQKYIHIKPDIQKEVDLFVAENFNDKFVIGVHYRGTDKICEAAAIAHEKVSSIINGYIHDNQIKDYRIFVATDEEAFLAHMTQTFPDKILSQNCLRSSDNNPIHYFNPKKDSPYKLGKEALIDCLLLSKCNHLYRTQSCLSLVSTFFNPKLSETLLNERTTHCYRRF